MSTTYQRLLAAVHEWRRPMTKEPGTTRYLGFALEWLSNELDSLRAEMRAKGGDADETRRRTPNSPDVAPPPVGTAGGDEGRVYPCEKCGKVRTKAESGTTFTVCDACWDLKRPTKEEVADTIPDPRTCGVARAKPEPEEFRAGLPAEALRSVCAYWEDDEGWFYRFLGDTYALKAPHANSEWGHTKPISEWRESLCKFKPHLMSRAAVEILAAERLGREDAMAGAGQRSVPADINNSEWGWLTRNIEHYDAAYKAAYAAKKDSHG